MKKILLTGLLFTSFVMSEEVPVVEVNKEFKSSKEMVQSMKQNFPKIYEVIRDYFETKTCEKDFEKLLSVQEVRDFTESYQFGVLIGLKYNIENSEKHKTDYYNTMINSYKFMNCGDKESLNKLIGIPDIM